MLSRAVETNRNIRAGRPALMSAYRIMPGTAKLPIRLHQTGQDVYGQREHRRIEKNEIAMTPLP
jgi:hypothetical protein